MSKKKNPSRNLSETQFDFLFYKINCLRGRIATFERGGTFAL